MKNIKKENVRLIPSVYPAAARQTRSFLFLQ